MSLRLHFWGKNSPVRPWKRRWDSECDTSVLTISSAFAFLYGSLEKNHRKVDVVGSNMADARSKEPDELCKQVEISNERGKILPNVLNWILSYCLAKRLTWNILHRRYIENWQVFAIKNGNSLGGMVAFGTRIYSVLSWIISNNNEVTTCQIYLIYPSSRRSSWWAASKIKKPRNILPNNLLTR